MTLNGNTLTLSNASGNFGGVIGDGVGGSGALTLAGGQETLSGANTYSGATTIGAGATLTLNGGSIGNSVASDAGALVLNTASTVGALSGAGSVTLTWHTLTLANGDGAAFSGDISGTGPLVLASGQQTLTGTNGYTGLTTINGGTLVLGSASAIAASSGVNVVGALALTTSSSIQSLSGSGVVTSNGNTLTLSNASGNFGGVIGDGVGGSGALTLAGGQEMLSGANTYSGATTIGAGATLTLNGGSIGNSVASDAGALVLNTASTVGALSGAGSVNLTWHTLTLANGYGAAFSGDISGTGPLVLASGQQTLTGPMAIPA